MGRVEYHETYTGGHIMPDLRGIFPSNIPLSAPIGIDLNQEHHYMMKSSSPEFLQQTVKKSPEEEVIEALRSPRAVKFTEDTIKESYGRIFYEHEQEAREMVEGAFDLLRVMSNPRVNGGKGISTNVTLRNAFTEIYGYFFKKDPSFWFQKAYKEYREERAKMDLTQVCDYIEGNKALDFGCGSGTFMLELQRNGFDVYGADPLDYRSEQCKNSGIPFYQMSPTSPIRVDFPDGAFDTTVVMSVLHHIDPDVLPPVLDELYRVTNTRLIVWEDMLCTLADLHRYNAPEYVKTDPAMEQYLQLSMEEQRESLIITDYFSNNLGGFTVPEMSMAFQFKTNDPWIEQLSQHGFDARNVFIPGFEKYKAHRNAQVVFICDKRK